MELNHSALLSSHCPSHNSVDEEKERNWSAIDAVEFLLGGCKEGDGSIGGSKKKKKRGSMRDEMNRFDGRGSGAQATNLGLLSPPARLGVFSCRVIYYSRRRKIQVK